MTWPKSRRDSSASFILRQIGVGCAQAVYSHNAYVFVGDGRKALFLRNEGDERFPNLKAERVSVDESPRTHKAATVLGAISGVWEQIGAAACSQPPGMSSSSGGHARGCRCPGAAHPG